MFSFRPFRVVPLLLLTGLLASGAACVTEDDVDVEDTSGLSELGLQLGEQSIFGDARPVRAADSDTAAVELGLKFRAAKRGTITGVRFYKGRGNTGTHVGHLWSASGRLLSSVTFTSETKSGWQLARFASPVPIDEDTTYVVSYYAPRGRYAGDNGGMTNARVSGDLTALADGTEGPNGVFAYGASAFPTQSYRATNYWVDVVFKSQSSDDGGLVADGGGPARDGSTTPDGAPSGDAATPPGASLQGWQVTAANIGIAGLGLSCASLPVYTGPSRPAPGTVISGRRIEGGLDLSAGNVVIERSCIRPTSVGRGMPVLSTTDFNKCNDNGCPVAPAAVTIRDSEIDGSLLSLEAAAYATAFLGVANVQRTYIHHFGSGIGLMNTGRNLDAVIENNFVTDMLGFGNPATTGNHSDAFTIRDFDISSKPQRQLVVRGNRFDCDSVNATGAFFVQTYAGNIFNVRVDGNLLEGNGYQLALETKSGNTYGNMIATNNRFSGTGFGAAYVTGGPGWTTWQDNYIANPSAADYKGKAIGKP